MDDYTFARRQFWLWTLLLKAIFYSGMTAMISRQRGYWNTEHVLIVLFLCTVPLAMWLTAVSGQYTLRRSYEEIDVAETLSPRQLVWSYVREIVIRQRWILLILIWLSSVLFPVAIIHNAHRQINNFDFFVIPPDVLLPDTILLVAMLVIGGIIGLGVGLMLISSGVSGAYRTDGVTVPLWQTMFNFGLILVVLYLWTSAKIDMITSIKPLLIGMALASIPILLTVGIGIQLEWRLTDLLKMHTHLAANCVSIGLMTGILGVILLPCTIVTFVIMGDSSVASDITLPATVAIFVPLIIFLVDGGRKLHKRDLFFVMVWVGINLSFGTIEKIIGDYAVQSFWWFNFFGIALIILGCVFYNVDRATTQLSPKN